MIGTSLRDDSPPGTRLLPRFAAFGAAVVVIVAALGLRLFQLQVVEGNDYQALAVAQSVGTQPIPVSRGLIYDRKGRQLVENVPVFVVKVRQADLPFSQRPAVVQRLSQLLKMPTSEIYETLDARAGARFDLVRIATDIPTETARVLAEEHLSLPGVYVDVEARRHYFYGPLLGHLLGWTGPISSDGYAELKQRGYLIDDHIGKAGVEATFERQLRGAYGVEEVQRDPTGRVIRVLRTLEEPQPGSSLQLTIDLAIQRMAEKAVTWATKGAGLRRGVFIVMNPQTGEILAMVSLPNYDGNLFARGISPKQYQELLRDPDRPLLNLAINEQYPPGSTYKLVTGVGGLSDGRIRPDTKLMTKAYIALGRWKYWDWNKAGWGPLTIHGAFGHSSDTFFFQVAGKLGIDRLAYWAHQFGFGSKTGIDLPGEVSGIVPTNDWKLKTFGQGIFPGETFQAGIGQGFNAVTPLQLVNAYAALANGGTLYRPQIVRRVLAPDGTVIRDFEPDPIRKLDVPDGVLQTIRVAARNVLVVRHTYNFVDLPVVVAGKSGTAEFGLRDERGRLPFHSWFVGFTPKDAARKASDPSGFDAVRGTDSQLAFLAFMYDSRTVGNVATEVGKYFVQLYYHTKVDLRQSWILQRGNFYGH